MRRGGGREKLERQENCAPAKRTPFQEGGAFVERLGPRGGIVRLVSHLTASCLL